MKKFIGVKTCYILAFCLLALSGCVKDEMNELSGNIIMKQNMDLPLGSKIMSIAAPSTQDTSSVPGSFGKYFYNGLPYSCKIPTFKPIYEEVDLNLTAKTKPDWIKHLTFNIDVENDYPCIGVLVIYLVDENGEILDKVFGNQGALITEAKTDTKGNVLQSSKKVIEVVYEGSRLDLLKQTKTLIYQATIQSLFFTSPGRLSDANKFKVTIGAKADLEYNTKDINK
jgi:hypothetical protein